MKNTLIIILVLLFLTSTMNCFSQDKLEKSKMEVAKGAKRNDRPEAGRSRTSSEHYHYDGPLEYMLFNAIARGFMFVTYHAAIGNYQTEDHLHRPLTSYPYFDKGQFGNYESPEANSPTVKTFRIDLADQYLHNKEGMNGNHLKLKIRPFRYFYLQADYFRLTEKGLPINSLSDLSLFNFNLCYDRIRLERFNLGWSMGLNYMGSEVNKAGFSYGFNAELFASGKISLQSSMKWSLINSAHVNEFEIQGKYHVKRCFFSLGYEHLKIGTPKYDFVSMGGGIYL